MNRKPLRSLIVGAMLVLGYPDHSHALTDAEALDDGMTLVESHLMLEMASSINPDLTREGVLRAARSHRLVIAINKASKGRDAQTLTIFENGSEVLKVKVSTGREKEELAKSGRRYISTTPKGYFRPQKIYQDYLSYTWQAPMPNAVFIIGGIALHATTKSHFSELGTRASGGCIRLMPADSLLIREKIMETGRGTRPGQFEIVNEAEGRNRIRKNAIRVDGLDRYSGDLLNEKIISWDTVVVVYEE
jgi:hypothetical protein